MKRLIYTFALLFVTLSAMAHNLANNSKMYFAKPDDWNAKYVQFMIGHDSYSQGYAMSSISNTKLYYVNMPSWDNYTQWAVFGTDGVWGGEGSSLHNRKNYAQNSTWVGTTSLKAYNLIPLASTTATTGDSYTFLNKPHTIKTQLDDVDNANVGDVTATYYELTAVSTATKTTSSITSSGTISVVYTSQVTLTANPADGYVFVGWYEDSTRKSTSTTYTYTAENSTKTVVAKFVKLSENPIYLELNYNWKMDNARFAAYFFNGSYDEIWVDMSELKNHDDVYYVLLPESSYKNIIFCRMNPKHSDNRWNVDSDTESTKRLWNKTGDLTLPTDGKNLFTLPGNSWDGATSTWSDLDSKDIDVKGGLDAGAYYGTMTYTMTFNEGDEEYWHWISLPFDVNISDVKGANDANDASLTYERDLVFKCYNTAIRASWPTEKAEPWELLGETGKLEAGRGYILGVGESVSEITFKSAKKLHNVIDKVGGNNVEYKSTETINSNWHLIGTGVYGNVGEVENINYVAVPKDKVDGYDYYYLGTELNANDLFNNSLSVSNLAPYKAFFVQDYGVYSFTKQQNQLAQNAAPRRARAEEVVEQYYVNIVGMADTSHTAIFLAEDGSDDYVVGKDFLHFGASGASLQLYTLQSENTLSFNYLKREDRTVLVGGYVAQSGKYTISLVAESDASSVLLYDATTGLAVDLLNENYEFEAEKGTLDGRFSVIISYAAGDGPATEVENDMTMGAVVVNCDGIAHFEGLLVGESVVVYDVVGRCVIQFVAENDEADVMLTSGVYMLYHNGETVKFVVNR